MATDSHYFSSVSSAAVICIEYSNQFRIRQMIRLMWPAGIRRSLQPRQRGPGRAPPTLWLLPAFWAQQIASFPLPCFGRKLCVKKARQTPRESARPEVASFPQRNGAERASESGRTDPRFWTGKLCKEWVSGPRLHFPLPGSLFLLLAWSSPLYN